ncbi:hypothetical protein FACS1894202_00920 [Clostridia bacterium]|nr:hypothetical protein FACS1894202_00920 [Clostridia bacterium]
MKLHFIGKTALTLGLAAIMALSPLTAMAADTAKVARTKAWDSITETLGGVPEKVRKIEYSGSTFYLGKDVTDADFSTVLAAGAEAVKLKPPIAANVSRPYFYPVYILWNADKTVLLVHSIIYDYDNVLEAVSVKTDPPASLTASQPAKPATKVVPKTAAAIQAYMLSDEYADEVRSEFYRLLNEHRAANGLKELEIDLKLQAYADIRADEQRERFGHTRPDGSAAGSGWNNSKNVMNSRYAENASDTGALGTDPKNAALGIFRRWTESKGHNKHMLYDFDPQIKMAFGIAPKLDKDGFVTSGAIFATGY